MSEERGKRMIVHQMVGTVSGGATMIIEYIESPCLAETAWVIDLAPQKPERTLPLTPFCDWPEAN